MTREEVIKMVKETKDSEIDFQLLVDTMNSLIDTAAETENEQLVKIVASINELMYLSMDTIDNRINYNKVKNSYTSSYPLIQPLGYGYTSFMNPSPTPSYSNPVVDEYCDQIVTQMAVWKHILKDAIIK